MGPIKNLLGANFLSKFATLPLTPTFLVLSAVDGANFSRVWGRGPGPTKKQKAYHFSQRLALIRAALVLNGFSIVPNLIFIIAVSQESAFHAC